MTVVKEVTATRVIHTSKCTNTTATHNNSIHAGDTVVSRLNEVDDMNNELPYVYAPCYQ
jgi:hypothetical protein